MAAPIELRHFLRRFTLADLEAGLQPVRQVMPDGAIGLFAPPSLQFRYREKTDDGGLRWSDWADVRFEREGDAP
jgi:hypothetical protein